MVVRSIRLCISISTTDYVWSMTQKIKILCEMPTGTRPDRTVQWWLSWSRTATWPGRKGDWSFLCHPGWRWHGWSRSTSVRECKGEGGLQLGQNQWRWGTVDQHSILYLYVFFLARLSGNFSTIQSIGFRRSIDITLLPTKDLVYEGNMISVFNVYLSMYICLHIVQGNTRSLEAFLVPSLAEFGVGLWPFLFFSSNHI